jgi:hypothetical protein
MRSNRAEKIIRWRGWPWLASLIFLATILTVPAPFARRQVFGVSFAPRQAEAAGLDWMQAYNALLDDLGVRWLRLTAYWDEIEPEPRQYDFSRLDYMFRLAETRGVYVVLVLGRKLPRWPECFTPAWAQQLSSPERAEALERFLEVVVRRYRKFSALAYWQVENEPFLNFGACDALPTAAEVKHEVALVQRLDSRRPVMITESGELRSWLGTAAFGDILGTTLYRTVYDGKQRRIRHYDGIIPAAWYRLRARLVRWIYGKPVIISELQAEPWDALPWQLLPAEQAKQTMSARRFREVIAFARRTQFPLAFLWGAEYWYWLKEKHGDNSMWRAAQAVFR